MPTLKPLHSLKQGDKFWFNDGSFGKVFSAEPCVIDNVVKDDRFPCEEDPFDSWIIAYHLDIPNGRQHKFYADESDNAVVITG